MKESIEKLLQANTTIAKLTESVITILNHLESKEERKLFLRHLSPHNVQTIANAALPQEYYEICQAAKEVCEEEGWLTA